MPGFHSALDKAEVTCMLGQKNTYKMKHGRIKEWKSPKKVREKNNEYERVMYM